MEEQRISVPRLEGVSQEHFMQHLYPQRKPLVLEGIDLGACTSKWTVDYLSQVGGKKEVKIHVAAVAQMDFIKLYLLTSWFRGLLKKSIKNSSFQRMRSTTYGHLGKTLERMLQISESSFLYWKETLSFQNFSKRNNSFPVFFELAHQDYNFGPTMMYATQMRHLKATVDL
uniref:tRNA-yW synthesizing protein 5 n=1 Tax=Rousettus aegyptiacus TaxID=9407 RepID=A0A7J8JQQ9_ROUAE|nr:tRNA-yW synthesizing protein 5 [Rousettus aegyptiacus]